MVSLSRCICFFFFTLLPAAPFPFLIVGGKEIFPAQPVTPYSYIETIGSPNRWAPSSVAPTSAATHSTIYITSQPIDSTRFTESFLYYLPSSFRTRWAQYTGLSPLFFIIPPLFSLWQRLKSWRIDWPFLRHTSRHLDCIMCVPSYARRRNAGNLSNEFNQPNLQPTPLQVLFSRVYLVFSSVDCARFKRIKASKKFNLK